MSGATFPLFLAGLVLLILGAELLVRGASRLASALGIAPLIIGLTVVAFGTGSPELAIAVHSTFTGQVDIAVGNVIGSNIFNILFILGLSALITPLVVAHQLVRFDVPIMIAASALVLMMAADGAIAVLDGWVLFAGIVVYTWVLLRLGWRRTERDAGPAPAETGTRRTKWLTHLALIALGLVLLVFGSRWLVTGAIQIARAFQVSELVIALTIVAAGTSLPEVATSIVAGVRGQRDIAVGNVVGSNLYNLLMVLGFAAIVSGDGLAVPAGARHFDLPVMLAASIACLPIFLSYHRVSRWEGGLFFGYWAAYTAYVFLLAARHDALGPFSSVMSLFVIPLTVITLAVSAWRASRQRARQRARQQE